jgi:hypothetical protein
MKRKQKPILIHLITIDARDEYLGEKMKCYACDAEHRALHAALVEGGTLGPDDSFAVPICGVCARDKDVTNVVFQKFFGAKMTFTEGGNLSDEQFEAMAESIKHSHN